MNRFCRISPTWFPLSKNVERLSLFDVKLKEKLANTDVFVATEVRTVADTMKVADGKKCLYFIQGYENWVVTDEYVQSTYRLGMTNIVISQWLKDIVDKYSSKGSVLIKDPIDINVYKVNTPIEERKKHSIGLLYHKMPHKGLKYSVEAIFRLKELYPDLEVYMFGVPKRPKDFPNWIHYTRKATQQQTVDIYNNVSVWLCATIEEGYGLTSLEAMACGCAVVSTAYTGILEYAHDNDNALLSPVKDVSALVNNVCKVFDDDVLRKRLVVRGRKTAESLSWDKAVDEFEQAIGEL